MNRPIRWGMLFTIGIIAYLLVSGNRGIWNLYQMHDEKVKLKLDVQNLETEILRNQMEYKSFGKSNSSFEKQAREDLNLIKPGEIEYKFASSNGNR